MFNRSVIVELTDGEFSGTVTPPNRYYGAYEGTPTRIARVLLQDSRASYVGRDPAELYELANAQMKDSFAVFVLWISLHMTCGVNVWGNQFMNCGDCRPKIR